MFLQYDNINAFLIQGNKNMISMIAHINNNPSEYVKPVCSQMTKLLY